jgi:nucleotide-binding universal stress UspA family protein
MSAYSFKKIITFYRPSQIQHKNQVGSNRHEVWLCSDSFELNKLFIKNKVIGGWETKKNLRELVIGSNTQRVVRKSSVPVLVIKNLPTKSFSVKGIVFATTLQGNVLGAFDIVAGLARLWKATVHILVVNFIERPGDQALIDKVVKELTLPYPDVSTTQSSIEVNDEEWGIHQFLEKTGADMMAITKYSKTGFILSHSVAEDLVNHEEVPILVLGSE